MDNSVQAEIDQKKQLYTKLWKMANSLRGNMDPYEFKDYILGLIFFRYICESEQKQFAENFHCSVEESFAENPDQCKKLCIENLALGYFIEPDFLFKNILNDASNGKFELQQLSNAFKVYSDSTKNCSQQLSNLFSDINLSSDKLGSSYKEKSDLIAKLICNIGELNFDFLNNEIDVLGDAYEYLIGQFAASAGKKAGEFYTPRKVSTLLSLIVTKDSETVKYISDPTCGSGSLLIQVIKLLQKKGGKYIKVFGQELNTTTVNLARCNMIIHGISYNKFTIHQGDVLKNPSDDQKEYGKMDIIVANPPFSAHWEYGSALEKDDRFIGAGKMAPKTKADYAFVLHMLNNLSKDGIMAVVLPHGPLFRSNAEHAIRKYLVETKNYFDTIIGLPENLFYGTNISATICVFRKNKTDKNIYFIDASKDFEKGKKQNILRDEDIKKILDAYSQKKEIKKYAHLATFEEIEKNDFNLNVSLYVDTFEEEEDINFDEVMKNYHKLAADNREITEKINHFLDELKLPKF